MNIRKQKTKFFTAFFLLVFVGLLSFSAFHIYSKYKKKTISGVELAAVNKNATAQANGQISDIPIFSEILNSVNSTSSEDQSNITTGQIFSRLFIALFLTSILAFRPKKSVPLFQRNFHVAQTQILLAVVAASLMMIVGNNAARAFAIFAAVSLVRFRTNIKDPKEITVLLVSLAVGLGAGVGYWQLAVILCFFVIVLLWFLELNEDKNSFRSMELTVTTQDAEKTRILLTDTFTEHSLESELRQIDLPSAEKEIGKITYFLNIPLELNIEDLTNQIISTDSQNIRDVEWSQKNKALQIYE